MMKRLCGFLASGAVVVAAGLLIAQERANPNIQSKGGQVKPGQTIEQDSTQNNTNTREGNTSTRRTPQQRDARQAVRTAALDQYVLACVIKENQGEIEVSKIAQQRASSPEVKEFAAKMIKEHTAFLGKLQAAQGGDAAQGQNRQQRRNERQQQRQVDNTATDNATNEPRSTDRDATTERDGNVRAGARAAAGEMAGRGQSLPVQTLTSISDEIHDRCLAALKQELEQKEGADFDKMFMGVQCGAHMKMASTLEVLQSHVSQDLSQTLKDGSETAKQHFTHAKEIAMKIEGKAGDQAKQRDRKTSRREAPSKE